MEDMMRGQRAVYRIAAMLLVSLLIAPMALPGVARADDDENKKKDKKNNKQETQQPAPERPDLAIEYSGFSPPNTDRTITFRVTNIGKGRSSPATAFLRAVSPPPENASQQDIPALGPGETHTLFYGLSGDGCNGHIVRAMINDPLDLNGTNDSLEIKVCPEKPSPSQGQGPGGPFGQSLGEARQQGTELQLPSPEPEYLQPGNHSLTRELYSGGWKTVKRVHKTGIFYVCDDTGSPTIGTVGFIHSNWDDANDCQVNEVFQTAMAFDLTDLRKVYGTLAVGRATLTWDDTKHENMGTVVEQADGSDHSCVAALGRPTADWRDANDLIPNEYLNDGNRTGRWNVTSLVLEWLRDPAAERLGVVLKGLDESPDAEDDETDCFSYLRNPRLIIDYTVLP
jgi:hypothetical protein